MIDLETVDLATVEARLVTDKGEMVVAFHPDRAPAHVRNFLQLAQDGFYNGTAFHRVIPGFMIQGGCPNTKEGATDMPGTGGPGHHVHAEFNDLEHRRGVLSMARSQDPNSAGSQFFIVHAEHADNLDGQYTVFGALKEGFDVLDEITGVERQFGPNGERSVPVQRIELRSVELQIAEVPVEEPTPADGEAQVEGETSGEAEAQS